MMKGFASVFKMLGLATLAIGLTVAGCADPGSDIEKQVSGIGHGAFTIPVTVDPANQNVTFGDGSNPATAVFDGHTVELIDTGCAGPDTAVACTVRVINRAADHYMSNATLYLSFCDDCVAGQNWANADCTGSPCVRACGVDSTGDVGCASASGAGVNNGFCVLEDGDFAAGTPYTRFGCRYHEVPGALRKPNQVIGPNDYEEVAWQFATADGTHFTMYANLTATWHPLDPHGEPATIMNAADWYNRSTMMLSVVDLDDTGADAMGNFALGTYRHSTVLAGYGAASNSVSLNPGQYFAVNVAVEYPDRIEAQNPGVFSKATDVEYPILIAGIIRFNPAIVSPVTVDGAINSANLTFVFAGGRSFCVKCVGDGTTGLQRRLYDSVTNYDSFSTSNSQTAFADKGYIYFFPQTNTNLFTWNTAAAAGNPWRYYTAGGGNVCTRTANLIPRNAGNYGNTSINKASIGADCATITTEAQALFEEPPDPDPDMPVGLFYFQVVPVGGGFWGDGSVSPSGYGTMFYPDAHSSYFTYKYTHTAGTVTPSGRASGSDDWTSVCIPIDPLYFEATNQGCKPSPWQPVPDVDWVYKGTELVNLKIGQTGQSAPGSLFTTGGYISWPAAIRVQ